MGRDQIRKEIERRILLGLAEGPQTLYGLSSKKKLSPSTLHSYLARLKEQGHIKPHKAERWRTGLLKREWTLTVKGFLRLLSERGESSAGRALLRQAVEVYGPILKYPVVRVETLYGKEAYEAWRAAKPRRMSASKKPPHVMVTPRVDFKPIFPIYYHEALRKDLGEKPYFRSLINAACLAYAIVEKEEAAGRLFLKTEEGKRYLAWRQEQGGTPSYQLYEEKKLVRNF